MRNDYLNQLKPNVSIVAEASASQLNLSELKPLDEEEKRSKIVNTVYNKKWPDGRIYGLSQDGSYTSHSVSPYSKFFLDNIEERIKPLIIALKEKGYLSLSSCEGHSIYFKRYVTLIFPSKETAVEFQSLFPFTKLKFELRHCTEVLNTSIESDAFGNILNSKKVFIGVQHEGAVRYINSIANRRYRDAWLLEMIISDKIHYSDGWGKYLKNWKEIVFRAFFIDAYTRRLTNHIRKHLKNNIY